MKRLLPLAFFLAHSFLTIAQSGTIDPSFGVNGKIVENFGFAYFKVTCGAVQSDGRIIIGGAAENGTNGYNNIDFFLIRFNANGTIDNSFGTNGIAYADIRNKSQDYPERVVLLPNGKILVTGGTFLFLNDYDYSTSMALFTVNGQLDAGFNGTGTLYTPYLIPGSFIDVKAQADGKILIAASNNTSGSLAKHMKFYWLNQDGTLDSKKLDLQRFANTNDYTVNSVGLLRDGKILTTGWESNKAFLARHQANGNIDSTFGINGRIDQGADYVGGAYLTLNADSTRFYTLSGARSSLYSHNPVWIQKMLLNGTPDASFGNNGLVTLPTDSSQIVYLESLQYLVQPNGGIIMGGIKENSIGINQFSALRLSPNGSLDNSFGSNGIVPAAAGGTRHETALVLTQPDGKSILAGYEMLDGKYTVALSRVNADGSVDNSFEQGGYATVTVGMGTLHPDAGQDIKILPDGKILASAFAKNGEFGSLTLVKYKPDGSRDASFGKNGLVYCDMSTYPYSPSFETFSAASIGSAPISTDAQGNIFALSTSYNTVKRKSGITILKFTPSGKRDSSFADYGRKTIYLPNLVSNVPIGMAIQADGKPVVAALTFYSTQRPDTSYITLFRFNTDGSPDLSFGVNGQVQEDQFTGEMGSRNQTGRLIIQPDGKILLCGEAKVPYYVRFAIRRYNPDGSVDPQFNKGIMVVTDVAPGKYNIATAIALQPDGKILVAGSNSGGSLMVRYTAEGLIDETFGDAGIQTYAFSARNVSNILVQPDGKILVAGDYFHEDAAIDQSFITLGRLRADGYPDATFGTNGTTTIVTSGLMQDIAGTMAMTPDGHILICGATTGGWEEPYARQTCDFVIYGLNNSFADCAAIKANAGNDTVICSGSRITIGAPAVPGYTYRWIKDAGVSSTTIAQPSVEPYFNQHYYLTVVDAAGCAAADSVFVKVNQQAARPTTYPQGSYTVCGGYFNGITLSTSATGSLQWLKDGVVIPGATNATYLAATTGQYSVQVSDTNTCAATSAYFALNVLTPPALPVVNVSGPLAFCQGDSVQLFTPAVAGSLQWANYGIVIPGANSNFYKATTSGQYTVRVTDQNNCITSSVTHVVTVNQPPAKPVIYANGPLAFCEGGSVVLATTTTTGSLLWLNNGLDMGGVTGTSYKTTKSGQYAVRETATNGCSATSATIGVTVYAAPPVPVITLNGLTLQSSVSTGNQWYLNDTAIQAATGATYVPKTSGNYKVKVTAGGCPDAVSNTIAIVTTGINSPELDRKIVMAPVPVIDDLNIQYTGNMGGRFTISVFNMYGLQLYGPGTFTTNFRLSMRDYPSGVYAVYIVNTLTGDQIHRLIMKQ